MRILSIAFFTTVCCGPSVSSFLIVSPPAVHPRKLSFLEMGGFGGGGSSQKVGGKKGKVNALKPKTQWDKFKALKQSSRVTVAARVIAVASSDGESSDDGQWYEVGQIKSEGDEFTELAVVMQRVLIAEHAKRVYPLQFLPKDLVEWSYKGENDDWIVVDKSKATDAPSNIAKMIGFQGNPDKSGFYARDGTQFAGVTSASPLAAGATLDRSVLPRRK